MSVRHPAPDQAARFTLPSNEAKARNIVRRPEHQAMRRTRAAAMARLHGWLVEEQPKQVPKGPLGQAVSYALNRWSDCCASSTTSTSPSIVGSGTGAVVCRLLLAVSAISGFVPV